MKSRLVKQVGWIRVWFKLLLLFWIIYNFIYGWNNTPINETERVLDTIFAIGVYLGFGAIVGILLTFIETIMKIVELKVNNKTL